MARGGLVPKRTLATKQDGSTYETTVHVRPDDAASVKFENVPSVPPSSGADEHAQWENLTAGEAESDSDTLFFAYRGALINKLEQTGVEVWNELEGLMIPVEGDADVMIAFVDGYRKAEFIGEDATEGDSRYAPRPSGVTDDDTPATAATKLATFIENWSTGEYVAPKESDWESKIARAQHDPETARLNLAVKDASTSFMANPSIPARDKVDAAWKVLRGHLNDNGFKNPAEVQAAIERL